MQTTGRIKDIAKDWQSDKLIISFLIDTVPSDLDELGGDALDITARRYRKKRSLNANSYFHALASQIATKNGESITETKNSLIAEYGQIDTFVKTVILDDAIDWRKVEPLHLRPTKATRVLDNGKLYRVYCVMRGSHTYDTAEMAHLIDGAVEAAKELGIETLTPDELTRMKNAWTKRDS